jgi:mevalonate kinase
MTPPTIRTRAPGKIILSGEHAVVHGCPALVTAVDRYVTCSLWEAGANRFHIELPALGQERHLTFLQLERLRTGAEERYEHFLAGELAIQQVLKDPVDLLACAAAGGAGPSSPGLRIRIDSDVPLGAGMGSSAAALAAILQAVSVYRNTPATGEQLFEQSMALERLQHGHPSGVDPAVCVYGGLLWFQQGQRTPLDEIPPAGRLIFTGTPESTTGECVEDVRQRLEGHPIWKQFEAVTQDMRVHLKSGHEAGWRAAVKTNHALLVRIGVVPKAVETFIADLEATGGAAKVCGAGSIRGDAGGMVMAFGGEDVDALCRNAGYETFDVTGGVPGVETV